MTQDAAPPPWNPTLTWKRRLRRRFLLWLARCAAFFLLRLTVRGRENLPAGGPLIVVVNHFGWIEPALTPAILPYAVEFLAAHNMFHHPRVGWIVRGYDTIPVHRGEVDRQALRAAAGVLEAGGVLAIFPEGGVHSNSFRSALMAPRPGTAYLAAQQQAPILPLAFSGSGEQVFGYWKRLRRAPVTLTIGRPFGPLTISGHGAVRREALDAAGVWIMEHLAALLPPAERGPFSGQPRPNADLTAGAH